MVTKEQVISRLGQLGYVVKSEDYETITFELDTILNYVKNYCNITIIPDILDNRIVDRVCSAFLFNQKNAGKLEGFNYEIAIKELKEGDTTIKYSVDGGGDTPESRFDSMVKQLERGFDKWLTPHRALRW
jgi:hypothetical protein